MPRTVDLTQALGNDATNEKGDHAHACSERFHDPPGEP